MKNMSTKQATRLVIATGLSLFAALTAAQANFFQYTFNYGSATVTDPISSNTHTYTPGSFSVDSLALMTNGQTSTLDISGNWNGFTPGEVLAVSTGVSPNQFEGSQAGCETTPTCGPEFTVTFFELRTTAEVTGPGTYTELAGVGADFCYASSQPGTNECTLADSASLTVTELPGNLPTIGAPEPASIAVFGTGLLGLWRLRRREAQRRSRGPSARTK